MLPVQTKTTRKGEAVRRTIPIVVRSACVREARSSSPTAQTGELSTERRRVAPPGGGPVHAGAMDPDACPPSSSALARARHLLALAGSDAADLRRRVRALAADTDWQARAADDYRTALAELASAYDRAALLIALADDDAGAAQRMALAGASCR